MKKAFKIAVAAAVAAAMLSALSACELLNLEAPPVIPDDPKDKYEEIFDSVNPVSTNGISYLLSYGLSSLSSTSENGFFLLEDEYTITTLSGGATTNYRYVAYSFSDGDKYFDCEQAEETFESGAGGESATVAGLGLYGRENLSLIVAAESTAAASAGRDITINCDNSTVSATKAEAKGYVDDAGADARGIYSTVATFVQSDGAKGIYVTSEGKSLRLTDVQATAKKSGGAFMLTLDIKADVGIIKTGDFERHTELIFDTQAGLEKGDFGDIYDKIGVKQTAYFDAQTAAQKLGEGFSAGKQVRIPALGGSKINIGGEWDKACDAAESGGSGATQTSTAAVYVDYKYTENSEEKEGTLAYLAGESEHISVQNGEIVIDGGLKEGAIADLDNDADFKGENVEFISVSLQLIHYEFARDEKWAQTHDAEAYEHMPFTSTLCASQCEL